MKEKISTEKKECRRIYIKGTVQGIGFRPYVYRLACRIGINGYVCNNEEGAVIVAEAPSSRVDDFRETLRKGISSLQGQITSLQEEKLELHGFRDFNIHSSSSNNPDPDNIPLPPDKALCSSCREEIRQPAERRYCYPFTSCTICGPRFTITRRLPYDRVNTSMFEFEMCPACGEEYRSPANRRFHAQPNACPNCGPHIYAVSPRGETVNKNWREATRQSLQQGEIVAVKGLGGFHLACDAHNPGALRKLRQRKNRPSKPFAVMARNLNAVYRYVKCDSREEALLNAPAAPIVTLLRRSGSSLPPELAPGLQTLGIMLPYTPLHELLFSEKLDLLVMTSGNRGGLPLVKDNRTALHQLGDFADLFLLHDREIVNRCDDSVAAITPAECGKEFPAILLRRSRGMVPEGISVPAPPDAPPALGGGSDKKNTFCFMKGNRAYPGQHLGDMEFREGLEAYHEAYRNWCGFMGIEPRLLGFDPHPRYHLTGWLLQQQWENAYPVQHHHAHLAAVMGEHRLQDKVLGAILDGTGWGEDGASWGFEILAGDYLEYRRLFHMKYLPLPGGERAVREPWRCALALLHQSRGQEYAIYAAKRILEINPSRAKTILGMVENRFNSPPASSGGRLFDAASALLGFCQTNTYEGEAAIRLSEALHSLPPETVFLQDPYPFALENGKIDFTSTALALAEERLKGKDPATAAARFHITVAAAVYEALLAANRETGLQQVVLGGGVWQNPWLVLLTCRLLSSSPFTVYLPQRLPPGDGGISPGQALVASWRWWNNVPGRAGPNNKN